MSDSNRTVKRKIRWGRVFIVLILFCLFLGGIAGAAYYTYSHFTAKPAVASMPPKDSRAEALRQRTNILLMGIDDGDNEYPDAPKRTDTMMVLSINPQDNSVQLISVPRDTRVNIPGHKGYDKVNHAFAYGGADLARRTVEVLLDVPINYYVVIDWQAFVKVIDILGGVDLYVEHDMNYEDPWADLKIHIKKGYQHLDGQKAGEYVRFRSDELGDIGRVQRQQRFMRALSDQALQLGTILKAPSLVNAVNHYVQTDMNFITMVKVANSMKSVNKSELATEMIPGKFATINGLSYWVPDNEQVKTLFNSRTSTASTVKKL